MISTEITFDNLSVLKMFNDNLKEIRDSTGDICLTIYEGENSNTFCLTFDNNGSGILVKLIHYDIDFNDDNEELVIKSAECGFIFSINYHNIEELVFDNGLTFRF